MSEQFVGHLQAGRIRESCSSSICDIFTTSRYVEGSERCDMRNVGNLCCFGRRRRRWHTTYTFISYCALTSLVNALFVSAAGTFERLLPNSIDEKVMSVFDGPLSVSASFLIRKRLVDEKHVKIFSGHVCDYRDSSALCCNQRTNASKRENKKDTSSSSSFCFPTKESWSNYFNRRLWKLRPKKKDPLHPRPLQ